MEPLDRGVVVTRVPELPNGVVVPEREVNVSEVERPLLPDEEAGVPEDVREVAREDVLVVCPDGRVIGGSTGSIMRLVPWLPVVWPVKLRELPFEVDVPELPEDAPLLLVEEGLEELVKVELLPLDC